MNPPIPFFGELAALLSSLIWAVSVILFRISGETFHPIALNLLKNSIGLALLLLTLFLTNNVLQPQAPLQDYLLLLTSGAFGIGIADSLFFASLNILGASRQAIVNCLYSPLIIFFSFLLLGEKLSLLAGLGALFIAAGVFLASLDRKKDPLHQKSFVKGAVLGITAIALMGFWIVYIKPLLHIYPVIWSATLRMAGGIFVLVVVSFFYQSKYKIWSVFQPQAAWKITLPACLLGSYPAFMLWIAAFKFAQANIAGLLTQTSVLFIVILAALFLKEPLTKWKSLALASALSGTVLIFL